jgi:NhaA family Na+:H+ antiporter
MSRAFFHLEASGGIVLMVAAVLALALANSPFRDFYANVTTHNVLFWINDGLMVIFFFLVGLEIKREIVQGELSSIDRALLPALAAVGGMAVPALIYWFINRAHPETLNGWAIPSATDIAFSLGVLALLGSRAPFSLKVLLTAIAIIDDLGAVLIIAVFYSDGVTLIPLAISAAFIIALVTLNLKGCSRIWPYLILGALLWLAMLKSGIHPTIAGVVTALSIPLNCPRDPEKKPVEMLESCLHPWVAFGVVPIFAFANAGVPFTGMTMGSLGEPIVLGVAAGLCLGKLIGIFGSLYLAIRSGLCPMPAGARWSHLWGVAHLCGIGFTMSLFIGGLAFAGPEQQADIRLGVLTGSVLSAILAFTVLKRAARY